MMKDTPIQSLSRGLELLRCVARSETGMSVREMAEILSVSRPTAHNLAVTLLTEGFLRKAEKPVRYCLGSGPEALVRQARDLGRRTLARESLEELSGRFPGAGWVYAEAEQDDMRMIWRLDFKRPNVLERVDREVSHPYDTATALIFHAFADELRAEGMRRRFTFDEFGRPIWGTRKAFNDFLARVRKAGGVTVPWSEGRELGAVAVPVFDEGNRLIGSVGAFYPLEQRERLERGVLEALRNAAVRLESAADVR